jgi:hypothetical protein
MKKISKNNKKAISGVVETLLILLLTIAAAAILATVVIPMIQKSLCGANCANVIGAITIDKDNGITCYNTSANETSISIIMGNFEEELSGFSIVLYASGSSENFKITNSTQDYNIRNYGSGDYHDLLKFPDHGEERTYVINSSSFTENPITSAEVYPIIACGATCDKTDVKSIPACV